MIRLDDCYVIAYHIDIKFNNYFGLRMDYIPHALAVTW